MILGMLKYHLLMLIREPANMFFGFGLPFLNLFLVSGTSEENPDFMNIAFPIFIVIAVLVLCFTDSALSHAHSRQIKFLRRLRMTPVKPITYIHTGIMIRLGVVLIFAVMFSMFTSIFFDLNMTNRNWFSILGVLVLVFAMFYFIGMFLANVFKNARTSPNALNIVFWVFILLSNAFFPIEAMPDIMQTITQNTPTIYAISLLQSAWLGTDILYGNSLIIVSCITVVFGLLSLKFFKYE